MTKQIEALKKYVRAANYISAAQIYLRDNFLLSEPLQPKDIKSRLLGHWGTCPGINFVYANLQRIVKERGAETIFLLGPGHGFPALQANVFMEGTLQKYYSEASLDLKGLNYIAKNFSWPYGFPSHSSPATPGVIVEGGELGYVLSTAYGAVLDNPGLTAVCLVGDGEAETGPTATAWHLHRFINPANNGAVLPILHLNGYKISGPTIFGRMSNEELTSLFTGYGYETMIVEHGDDVYEQMISTIDKAYSLIETRRQDSTKRPPMIILRTPKGWTGIQELKGKKLEGNHSSHQVIAPNAKTDQEELLALENWLRSYNFKELFDAEKGFCEEILGLLPPAPLRLSDNPKTMGMTENQPRLILPEVDAFLEDATVPGTIGSSSMRRSGLYLTEVFRLNKQNKNFRLMSPDETYSNKLDQVFTETSRAWVGRRQEWDKDLDLDGRVMEMLSEHSLQGLLQGYVLTGRYGIFASYEAFIQVVSSMADQYAKFLKVARETSWRRQIPSFNYILTSSGWRQEHNGFSHQNPGFIDNMLQKQGCFSRVFFPTDGNSTLVVLKHCLSSHNEINIIVAGKTLEPRWLTKELAEQELKQGLMIWDFASEPNPDIVFSAVGEYLTKETLAAITLIKTEAPEIKVRFVNILEMSALGIGANECRVTDKNFEEYFTVDKPVIFNFHGYPETLKQSLFDHQTSSRPFLVNGYIENGSTTTPFDLHLRNRTSRYDLFIQALNVAQDRGIIDNNKAKELIEKYQRKMIEHKDYIINNGVDPEEIENWQWQNIS